MKTIEMQVRLLQDAECWWKLQDLKQTSSCICFHICLWFHFPRVVLHIDELFL